MIPQFVAYPFCITIFILYPALDPLSLLISHLSPFGHLLTSPVFLFIRFLLVFPPSFHVCRVICFFHIHFNFLTQNLLSSIRSVNVGFRRLLKNWGMGRFGVAKYLWDYLKQQVLTCQLPAALGEIVASFMFMSLVACVSFNFVTVKVRNTVPMPFYLYFPSISVMIPIELQIMLQTGIDVFEESKQMCTRWKALLECCPDRKFLRRKLQAMRPIGLYGSISSFKLYWLKKSVKPAYYSVVVGYTITALLSMENRRSIIYI